MTSRWAVLLGVALGGLGCNDKAIPAGPKPPAGLTREQAAAVLARVGGRTITVGDFATSLERLDDVDRLRFQTLEARKELLEELIDLELLTQEARQRGLDDDPGVQAGVLQVLRDAMLAKAREGLPAPAEIPASEVAAYYEAHRDEYQEPERRRVSAIVLATEAAARDVLAKARTLDSAAAWGALHQERSVDAPKVRDPAAPLELAGDRGLVGAPGDLRLANARVPADVQAAVFQMAKVGDVAPTAIRVGDRYWVVRLTGIAQGRVRTLAEADRTIRVALLQEQARAREQKLAEDLRARFEVAIDEAALAEVRLPAVPVLDAPAVRPAASASP